MKILMVEDDEMIGSSLKQILKNARYLVDWAKNAEEALYGIETGNYELILLDIGLPDKSGFEVLQTIRASRNNTPILILTARDSMEDKIYGLDIGADDYITKPFNPDELLARLRSIIRRHHDRATTLLVHYELTLDVKTYELNINNKTQKLPLKEFIILKTLMESIGTPFSKEQLEEILYSWDDTGAQSNTIEVFIYSLRKKIGSQWIKNIRGLGYFIPKQI